MRKRYSDRRGIWRRTALAGAVAACFAGNTALANPTGPAVTQGQASFATQGNTLTVTNAPGTVINWQGFSIAGSEITRFIQQSQMSAVLNRVVGVNPSAILGTLQSNGRVYLVNPNGITVGPGANIDVAGFLASTLNLSDGDFLSGRMRFTETPGAGSVVNEGAITTATGGMVYLVGRDVKNSGIIRSPQGEILLAAGRSIELVDAQTPELRVELTAPDNQVLNVGQLIAEGGRIGMYGTLVAHSGVASANTAVVGENGKIVFKAIQDVTLDAGSVTTASGPQGGSVTVQAENGTLLVSGTIEAKGEAGKGGTIQLTGDRVGLIGNAAIDASGLTGGGTVLVGGDFQGSNPDVPNAQRTYVGSDARIAADAIETGDGGKVIVWSDEITRAYGTISARGGTQGGDGGLVEVSGKNLLDFAARVDTSAPMGHAGTILLDPLDITIQDTGGANNDEVTFPAIDTAILFADGGAGVNFTINDEKLEALSGDVILQAQRDITVGPNLSGGLTFTNLRQGIVMQAGRDIIINAALTTNAGKIILEADSPHQPGFVPDGVGLVRINAPVNSCGGAVLATCTGANITLIGGSASSPTGGFVLNADVNAGNGGINVALSTNTRLDFFIGAGGNTQLSSNDTGSLKTTGTLVLGRATSGGPNGLGTPVTGNPSTGAVVLTVDSLSQLNATPIDLSADSGSTFQLVAGDGGIRLDRNLTSFQTTRIETTGTFTLNARLDTSNSNLVIVAADVDIGDGGSITTGTGTFGCTSMSGCPSNSAAVNQWNVDTSGDWFLGSNWTLGTPTSAQVVLIDRPSADPTISLGSAIAPANGSAGLLVNNETLNITGNATTKSTLTVTSDITFQGSTASINTGTINLNHGSIVGTGALFNQGTLSLTNGTVSAALSNEGLGAQIVATGTNAITGAFSMLGGAFNINSGTTTMGMLTLSGGTVNGVGDLSVTSEFTQDGGMLGTTFSDLLLTKSGAFIVDLAGITAVDSVTLISGGAVTLDGAVTATTGVGDSIVISGVSFTNNAGTSALNPGAGRFLVWSGDPASDTRGGLAYDFKQYNATYGVTTPAQTSGNGFLYSVAPTITPGLTGTVSKVYDGTVAATLAAGNYTVSGAIDGDTVTLNNPGAGTYADKNAGTGKTVTATGVAIASATDGSANVFGYQLSSTSASGNIGDITALGITGSITAANKTYDATTAATITSRTLSGTILGDTVSYTGGTATFADKNAGTGKTVTATGLGLTGADAGNYTVNSTAATTADINPAVVSVAGSRAYDGSAGFTAGSFSATISGTLAGETLTIAGGTGTVASPKVLAGTQTLATGTLALGNGTNGGVASNYTLAGGAHTGTITASLTFPFVWDLSSAVDLDWGNPANWNQGAVPLNGAAASIPSGLAGPVVYSSASGATSLTTLSSGSGFTITGGTLTLGNSTADVSTFSGRPLTLNGGTLDGVGTISLAGTTLDVLAGGVLGGSRTIIGNVNNLAGTVSPGASPGTMTIDGNYLQGPSGTLLAEIGGLAAGTQYDQLIVSGTVTLDGNLNVALGNGFIPATGDTFTIIDSGGGVSGTFATTSLPSASPMQVDLLASSVNVTTGTLAPVDTAQLISFQLNQIDASLPTETDMSKFIVVTDPITNETFVTVGAVEIAVSGGAKERAQKPGVCR